MVSTTPVRGGVPRTRAGSGLTPDGRLKHGKLAGLSMRTAIWRLSWPILVESFLTSTVVMTDTVLAAGLSDGEAATDAIGAASYIGWFLGLVVMAVGVGATALVSRAVGGGRRAVADAACSQSLVLIAAATIVAGGIVAALANQIAPLFRLEGASREMFTRYLVTIGAAMPLTGILHAGLACVRGAGDSRRPLLIMIVVNIVNAVASFILSGAPLKQARMIEGVPTPHILLENSFGFGWGVTGIAVGTMLSSLVGAVLVLGLLTTGVSGVRARSHRLRPHRTTMWRLINLAWPGFLETMGLWFGNVVVMLFVARLGIEGAMGSHIVAIRIESFSFMPGFAMGVAAATLVGQYLGAGSAKHASRAAWVCTGIATGVMGVIGALIAVFPVRATGIFTSVPQHLATVPDVLVIAGALQAPFAISLVMRAALRGAGDVRAVMWLMWITTYAIRVPLVWLISGVTLELPAWLGGGTIPAPFGLEPSLNRLWLALMLELVVRGGLFLARFLQGKWRTARA